MKPDMLRSIFGHPLAQLVVFCCLFFCGEVLCVPYLFVIRFALAEGQPFAILGCIGLVLTLISLFTKRFTLQGWGLAALWASLVLHFITVSRSIRGELIQYPLQYLIVLLFLCVTTAVILKIIVWKSS